MVTKESIKLPHKKGKTPSIDFHYSELLGRIQKITHTRTQAGLAAILNVSQSSVAEAKRRQSIPADWYLKLFEKLGVNPDWLKKGNGPVYLRTEAGYVPSDGDGPPIDPGLLGSPLAQSALAPVYAMCGDSTKTGSPAAALQPIGKIALPNHTPEKGSSFWKWTTNQPPPQRAAALMSASTQPQAVPQAVNCSRYGFPMKGSS